MQDFLIENHGSIIILTPMTDQGRDWASENLPDDAQQWGTGVVVEPRYIELIVKGIQNDGLTIGA